jgi:hypothetical protein
VYSPSSGGQAFWLPGISTDLVFTPDPGSITVNSDGSFRMTGTLKSITDPNKGFTVDVTFSGYTTTTPSGSPKKELQSSAYVENGGPVNPATWIYFTSFSGTLTGTGTWTGATVALTRTGPAFQVGVGANNKNVNFGGSGWFNWSVTHQPNSGGSLQSSGQGDVNFDFIDCQITGSVGDRVWLDTNGNGVQDSGEAGVNGATIQLVDGSGTVIASAITAGDGNYTFNGLLAGNYSVKVVSSSLPAGLTPTYDLNGVGTAHVASFSLAAGADRTDVDFGYRGTLSIGDRVWKDTDRDGVQDSGEPGLSGVTVQLVNSGGTVVATTTTNSSGNYSFANLPGGNYTVKVVSSSVPAGLTPSYDLDGISTAHQASFSLTSSRTDVDFGYKSQPTNPGTGTIGYWKNHPEAWPVQSITLGNVTYTKTQAISILGQASSGDKSIDLAKQLIAAKLNVIIDNDSSCIASTITSADNWLRQYPVGSNVGGSSTAWQTGGPLHTMLDNYNNGNLCAPHRD